MIEMWAGIGGRGLVLGRGVPAMAGRVKAKKRGRGIGWSGERSGEGHWERKNCSRNAPPICDSSSPLTSSTLHYTNCFIYEVLSLPPAPFPRGTGN
jgi:hypothetical protein